MDTTQWELETVCEFLHLSLLLAFKASILQKCLVLARATANCVKEGPMGRLLVRGEWGHDIIDELAPIPGEVVIDKPGKGSYWGTGLHRVLLTRGVTHLLVTGVTTE
jgi:nicotinamidase-related amidase